MTIDILALRILTKQASLDEVLSRLRELETAAANENHMAQMAMGTIYFHGLGVDVNFSKGIFWARQAAEKGCAQAVHTDSAIFLSKNPVESDITTGVVWKGSDVTVILELLQNRARAEERDERLHDAAFSYTTIINLPKLSDEDKAEAFINRGMLKRKLNDLTGAIADYDAVVENPNVSLDSKACALNNRGVAKDTSGDIDSAISDLSKTIEMHGVDPFYRAWALNYRGSCKAKLGDFFGAIEDYDNVVAIKEASDDQKTSAFRKCGIAKHYINDFTGAIHAYNNIINSPNAPKEDKALALYNRAVAEVALDDIPGSITSLDTVISMADLPIYYRTLALVAFASTKSKLGNIADAIAKYNTVLSLSDVPKEHLARALNGRAGLYRQQKKNDLALLDWMMVLDTEFVTAEVKERALAQLRLNDLFSPHIENMKARWQQTLSEGSVLDQLSAAIKLAFVEAHQSTHDNTSLLKFAFARLDNIISGDNVSSQYKAWALDHRAYLNVRINDHDSVNDCFALLTIEGTTTAQRDEAIDRLYVTTQYFGLLRQTTATMGISFDDLTRAVQETGPIYNTVNRDGIAMPGSLLPAQPLRRRAWTDVRQAVCVDGRIEISGVGARNSSDAFIFDNDIDVLLAVIFLEDATLHSRAASFSLETPEKLKNSKTNKGLINFCQFTPEWLSATDFGKTMFYCDYMLKLAWGCITPSFFDASIFAPRMCLQPELRLPDWMADLNFVGNDAGIKQSAGRLCWKIRNVKIGKDKIRPRILSVFSKEQERFSILDGQVYVETSLINDSDGPNENRSILPDDERTHVGKQGAAVTRKFDELCSLFPTFCRLKQLLRLYALLEKMKHEGVQISVEERHRLEGVRRMYKNNPRNPKWLFVPRPPASGTLGAYGGVTCGCPNSVVYETPAPLPPQNTNWQSSTTAPPTHNNDGVSDSASNPYLPKMETMTLLQGYYNNGQLGRVEERVTTGLNGSPCDYRVERYVAEDGKEKQRLLSMTMTVVDFEGERKRASYMPVAHRHGKSVFDEWAHGIALMLGGPDHPDVKFAMNANVNKSEVKKIENEVKSRLKYEPGASMELSALYENPNTDARALHKEATSRPDAVVAKVKWSSGETKEFVIPNYNPFVKG